MPNQTPTNPDLLREAVDPMERKREYRRDLEVEQEKLKQKLREKGKSEREIAKELRKQERDAESRYRKEILDELADKGLEPVELTGFGAEESYLDEDEFQRFLADNFTGDTHRFLAQCVKFEFNRDPDKASESVRIIPPGDPENIGSNKIIIELNSLSFHRKVKMVSDGRIEQVRREGNETLAQLLKDGQEKTVPDLTRLRWLITKAIARVTVIPENWSEIERQIYRRPESRREHLRPQPAELGIGTGIEDRWLAFVAIYLADRELAENLSPEGAKELDERFRRATRVAKDKGKPDSKDIEAPKAKSPIDAPDDEYLSVAQAAENRRQNPGAWAGWEDPELTNPNIGIVTYINPITGRRMPLKIRGVIITYTKTDWMLRAKADFDNKEVARIVQRDEGIVDRDRRLLGHLRAGERREAFQVLMADSKFADLQNWRLHAYLAAFDPLYQRTSGEEITELSYNEVIQLRRESNRQKRHGTKPTEYEAMRDPETGLVHYRRMDFGRYLNEVKKEIREKSARMVLNTAQEAFEYMMIDEGAGRYAKPHDRLGEYVATGKLSAIIGNRLTQELLAGREGKKPVRDLYELDADQICVMARLIAMAETSRTGEPRGLGEHITASQIDAIEHYKPIFDADPELKKIVDYFRAIHSGREGEFGKLRKTDSAVQAAEDSARNDNRDFEHYVRGHSDEQIVDDLDDLRAAIKTLRQTLEAKIETSQLGDGLREDLKKAVDKPDESEVGTISEALREIRQKLTGEELKKQQDALMKLWADFDELRGKIEEYRERLEEFEDYIAKIEYQPDNEDFLAETGNTVADIKEEEEIRRTSAIDSPERQSGLLAKTLIEQGFAGEPQPSPEQVRAKMREVKAAAEISDPKQRAYRSNLLRVSAIENWIKHYGSQTPKVFFDFLLNYLPADSPVQIELENPPAGLPFAHQIPRPAPLAPESVSFETYDLSESASLDRRLAALRALKILKAEIARELPHTHRVVIHTPSPAEAAPVDTD